MSDYYPYPKRDPIKNYFPLPNEIFLLGLTPGELAVYSYLIRCEDRKTHQCHPSYRTIGKFVHLSPNTVAKHVNGLREKRLITTENTEIVTKRGEKRNGTLLYTIRPVEEALRHFYEQQMQQLEAVKDQEKVRKKLAKLDRKRERAGYLSAGHPANVPPSENGGAHPRASRDGSSALGLHGAPHPYNPPRCVEGRGAGACHSQKSY